MNWCFLVVINSSSSSKKKFNNDSIYFKWTWTMVKFTKKKKQRSGNFYFLVHLKNFWKKKKTKNDILKSRKALLLLTSAYWRCWIHVNHRGVKMKHCEQLSFSQQELIRWSIVALPPFYSYHCQWFCCYCCLQLMMAIVLNW